jgi:hypothetical protein
VLRIMEQSRAERMEQREATTDAACAAVDPDLLVRVVRAATENHGASAPPEELAAKACEYLETLLAWRGEHGVDTILDDELPFAEGFHAHWWGTLYKLNPALTYSLKAPGFNHCTYQVISWFQNLLVQIQLVQLRTGRWRCTGATPSGTPSWASASKTSYPRASPRTWTRRRCSGGAVQVKFSRPIA